MSKITITKEQLLREILEFQHKEKIHSLETSSFNSTSERDLLLLLLDFAYTDSCIYPQKLKKIESQLIEINNKLKSLKLK